MPSAAIAGVVTAVGREGALPLGPVLDALAPFGDRRDESACTEPGLTATVGARWSGRQRPLAQGSDAPPVVVVGDVTLADGVGFATRLGRAATATPAELVAAAYDRWGDDWPRHVDGAYAVAVLDARRAAVTLYVDHAGQRPLAFWSSGAGLAFASSPLALTALAAVGHELDVQRAREALALVRSARSFVHGVEMVEAGSAIAFGPGGLRRWRWWAPERIVLRDLGSLDRHAEELRARLEDAVRGCTTGAGRVGVSLSGGLDSTAIAATIAAQRAPDAVRTYTAVPSAGWVSPGPSGRDPDESPLVRLLAERYPNLRPRFVSTEGRNVFEGFEPLWELGAPPMRNVMNGLWIRAIHEEAAADGVDVLLTGAIGNLAFSADGPRVLVELLRRGRVVRVAREARARAVRTGVAPRRVLRAELVDLVWPPRSWRRSAQVREARLRDWLGATALRDEQAGLVDVVGGLPVLGDADGTRWTRRPQQVFAAAPNAALAQNAVRAWYGVEVGDPTAARALLEAAFAQPDWWRRHDGVTRAVARRAMADRLPGPIVERTIRGAQLPDWLDRLTEVRASVEAELEAARDHPPSRELIDVERLTGLVRAWPATTDANRREVVRAYRLALARALLLSRYLRWFDERARRVAAGGPAVVLPLR